MFEHLDDPSPRTPGDDAREAVQRRGSQLAVRRRLMTTGTIAAVALLALAGPLLALRSDGGRRRVTATGRPTTTSPEPAGVITGVTQPDANGSTTTTSSAVHGATPTTQVHRPGATTTTVAPPPKAPLHLADAIVFSGNPNSQPGIWIMNADGSAPTRLTNGPQDASPAWAPDRSAIVFVHGMVDKNALSVMKPDGSDQRLLTSGASDQYPAWSHDGRRIAFSSDRNGGGIFYMNVDGTGITKVIGDGYDPTWSPDGKKLAFTRDDNNNAEIYAVNVDGSGAVDLSNNPQWDAAPAWSPDGTKIAFESGRDGTPQNQDTDIYVMNADGSNPVQLAHSPNFDHNPAWSPDGTRIAFDSLRPPACDATGCYQHIWAMRADGSGVVQLTPMPGGEFSPGW